MGIDLYIEFERDLTHAELAAVATFLHMPYAGRGWQDPVTADDVATVQRLREEDRNLAPTSADDYAASQANWDARNANEALAAVDAILCDQHLHVLYMGRAKNYRRFMPEYCRDLTNGSFEARAEIDWFVGTLTAYLGGGEWPTGLPAVIDIYWA